MSDLIKVTVRCRRQDGMFRAGRKWLAVKQEAELTQEQINALVSDSESFIVYLDGKQLGAQTAEPEAKDQQLEALAKAHEDLQSRFAEVEAMLREARAESKDLRSENEALRKEYAAHESEIKKLSSQNEAFQSELKKSSEMLDAATNPKGKK